MNEPQISPDPKERFTGRVDFYRRFRLPYPREILPLLGKHCALHPDSVVADIGAGTGMLAEPFLENGNTVIAVEPNAEMRAACSELAQRYPRFRCREGTAEATGIPSHCVDFVTAGRAFHWFDQEKCRPEFLRILKPGGWVVLVTNGRQKGPEPVLREYENILRKHGREYAALRRLGDWSRKFFATGEVHQAVIPGEREMSYEELEGQTVSFSIMPVPGDPGFPAMQRDLKKYFERHQSGGKLRVPTACKIYFGQLR